MELHTQNADGCFRLAITRDDGREILCLSEGDTLSLPFVRVNPSERRVDSINSVVRESWGLEAYCLYAAPEQYTFGDEPSIQWMECIRSVSDLPSAAHWVPLHSLSRAASIDAHLISALRSRPTEFSIAATRPFIGAKWFRDLWHWTAEQIAPRGMYLTGAFRQIDLSPEASLFRFETNGPAVWFKSNQRDGARELTITSALTSLFPSFMPAMLAVHSEWNGWLMEEAVRISPTGDSYACNWFVVARSLAQLQLASIPHARTLRIAGCRNIDSESLFSIADEFFATMAHLMSRQPKAPPVILSPADLAMVCRSVKRALVELDDFHIPATLNHLDINPGNIFVADDRCTFIDWAEAAIGHPVFTFQYVLEHFKRLHGRESLTVSGLASSYADEWKPAAFSPDAFKQSLFLAPLLAAYAYAASNNAWRDSGDQLESDSAGYFRALTRRMKREADLLQHLAL
jgi:Phosphotransferase enzyme family